METQEVHLSHYWNVILKRWRVAAGILVTVLLVTFVYSQFSRPLYRATVTLQIERDNPNLLTVQDLFGIEPSSQQFLQTQFALLKSRSLAERVIDDLQLLSDPDLNPGGIEGRSTEELDGIKGSLADSIASGVVVRPIEWTSLVEVGYIAPSPKLAQKVANGIGESYITAAIERSHTSYQQANSFLSAQIEQLKGEIESAEKELQTYRETKEIISMDERGNISLAKLDEMNREYTAAQNERIQKQIAYDTLSASGGLSAADVLNSDTVAAQRAELGKLQNEYAQKLGNLKPEHPQMIHLRSQIEKSRQALAAATQEALVKRREEARTALGSAIAREQRLEAVLEGQKREVMTLNSAAGTYMTIQATIQNKRQLLDQLRKRLNETEVSSRMRGTSESNIRIVDYARLPTQRFNETLTRNMRNALPLGLVLGFAAIFFFEYLDRSLKTAEEVEQATGFASLGLIPSASSLNRGYGYYGYGYFYGKRKLRSVAPQEPGEPLDIDLIPATNPRSPIAEAYRAFRTSLLLASAKSPRVILITSTSPREGKTTTSVNLAVVLAQLGQPVLIIDGDLRKPRLHKLFKSTRLEGIVNYLAMNTALDHVIQDTSIPNLSFIGCGPIPPNPCELLASERMHSLVTEIRERFAYVIIDSPPMLAVADSIILSPLSDGVVLCVHGGVTPRELVHRAAARLRQANVAVLGTILNNLDMKQHGYSYSKHYYAYYEDDRAKPAESPLRTAAKKVVGRN